MNKLFRKAEWLNGPAMPLFNRGDWNSSLHPRDSDGEFRYNGGRHRLTKHHSAKGHGGKKPRKMPPPPTDAGGSALRNALSRLRIDTTYAAKQGMKAKPHGIYITHYGPGEDVGGWDPSFDRGTDSGEGNHGNNLNTLSLAVSKDIVKKAHLRRGGPVYINDQYIGNYDDTPRDDGRIDIYDYYNEVGAAWSGMVWGGVVANHP